MGRCVLVAVALIAVALDNAILTSADDNNIFLYNSIDHCKVNEYFDVNYFICKPCDMDLYLMRAINGEYCRVQWLLVAERTFLLPFFFSRSYCTCL